MVESYGIQIYFIETFVFNLGDKLNNTSRKIWAISIGMCLPLLIWSCGGIMPNRGVIDVKSDEEMIGPRISSDVAILIAKGLVAEAGLDLNLYRVESVLDGRNRWKIEFILQERYIHFNVRCATVYIDSGTGEVGMNQYPDCGKPPLMNHATKAKHYSLPGGSIGIYIGGERTATYEIIPSEWGALFWDELAAVDPNYVQGWEKLFSDSIPNYPHLSKIHGEVGSRITFEKDEINALMEECVRISESAENPIARNVTKKILTACELAKQKSVSVHFVGD